MNRQYRVKALALTLFLFVFLFSEAKGITEECKSDSIFNYYPQSTVEASFGMKASKITGEGMNYTCNDGNITFHFEVPTGQSIEILPGRKEPVTIKYQIEFSIRKSSSPQAAQKFYQESFAAGGDSYPLATEKYYQRSSLGIGDKSTLIGIKDGSEIVKYKAAVRNGSYVYSVSSADVIHPGMAQLPGGTEAYNKLNAASVTAKIKSILGSASSKTPGAFVPAGSVKPGGKVNISIPASPPPSNKNVGDPTITKFNPSVITAGTLQTLDSYTGNAIYTTKIYILEVTGENLDGAQLSADNIGDNKNRGIEFRNTEIKNDGKYLRAHLLSHPWAKDGKTKITITNSGGGITSFDIDAKITGTQYLRRKFSSEKVKFLGDWAQLMPDQKVLDLEKNVLRGFTILGRNSYKKLGLITHIYEPSFWKEVAEKKYCGVTSATGFNAAGCADWEDNIIHVVDYPLTASTMLHEAAHKLHFYYKGSYQRASAPPNSFEREWKSQLGDLKNCTYLPLRVISWSDGTSEPPHCGFVRSYGAYQTDRGLFYEDVATFTQTLEFFPNKKSQFDPKDQRYQGKINLLKKYDF